MKDANGIREFFTTEPLQTVIDRADAENVKFAVNYNPKTRRIDVEFHGSVEISVVEVSIDELKHLAETFRRAIKMIEDNQTSGKLPPVR